MVAGSLGIWDPRALSGAGSLANRLPSPPGVLAHERLRGPSCSPGEVVAQERSARPEVALPSSPEDTPMARRNSLSDDVMIAVDPHKASNTAAVLDPVPET